MNKLDELMKEVNKKFKDEIFVKGTKWTNTNIRIPFSSPCLNYMTYGGIPLGRAVQFFGVNAGGKTTTALDVVANAQRVFAQLAKDTKTAEKEILFIDAENTFDEFWAETLGVNVSKLRLLRPQAQSAEDIFQIILDAVNTGELGLIVLDSVGVLLSNAAWESNMDEKTYCGIAGPLTTFVGKITPLLHRYNTTLIYINQIRDVLNSRVPMLSTPGGRALSHSLSMNLRFQKDSLYDELGNQLPNSAENPAGHKIKVFLEKTKVSRSDRKIGYYTLNYRYGVDRINDLIDLCRREDIGLVENSGAWFTLNDCAALLERGEIVPMKNKDGDVLKFQGKPKLVTYLKENPLLAAAIENAILRITNKEVE